MTAPAFSFHRLSGRAVASLAGEDAAGFLQGLVTADVSSLASGEARYGALLTPQGKILFDFFMFRRGDAFLIDCASGQRGDLIERLGFYKLRAKVTIAARDDLEVAVSLSPVAAVACYADPRSMELGYRLVMAAGEAPEGDETVYRRQRMALGIADSPEIGSGELFPHEANLDQISGVSFSKGCYVGQEVVSRMEHRGTARSRLLPVTLSQAPKRIGGDIIAANRPVGTLIAAEGSEGLALIRLDRLREATDAGLELLTEGAGVRVSKPPWAKSAHAGG